MDAGNTPKAPKIGPSSVPISTWLYCFSMSPGFQLLVDGGFGRAVGSRALHVPTVPMSVKAPVVESMVYIEMLLEFPFAT